MFYGKGVLENLATWTEKYLFQSLFFNKIACLKTTTLFKKEALAQVFSCELCEFFKNTFFTKHLRVNASVLNATLKTSPYSQKTCFLLSKVVSS